MPNRLANESSPYLLQHKDNPVDWYPWGDEALARAKAEDKAIFISIGYSACHWCHVMEHESFEDPDTAALMNELFVNIKVDREERPDLDGIYMAAVVSLTGQGGWPMSVWLTPEGVPFHGGTYFPSAPRYGMPSFKDVLRGVNDAWLNRRDELLESGDKIKQAIGRNQMSDLLEQATPLSVEVLDRATRAAWSHFDHQLAGWGNGPKFPQPMLIEFLLRQQVRTGDPLALEMAEKTLQAMAEGGMYDQLGGGFHRYSVDDRWLAPHFEKMLYDNAQLARVYLHAYQLTGKPFYRRITEETCDYILREMTDIEGGFYSTQDADSEGVEGKFFVWSPQETVRLLGDDAELFNAAYDITPAGNFEGHSIPRVVRDVPALAAQFGLSEDDVRKCLAVARKTLWEHRERRIRPALDDKIITGWNGMMLAALAEAARVLDRDDYRDACTHNAAFLLNTMRDTNGRLWRTQRADDAPKLNAYLEDYANLVDGLLELYQTTFDEQYFSAACKLADIMLAHYADHDTVGFYDTSDDHEQLITRPKDIQDNATPSGNAVAADVLLKLAAYTGNGDYQDAAEAALRPMEALVQRSPSGFARWLQAMSFALGNLQELALVGSAQHPDTRMLLNAAQKPYRPFQVVALRQPGVDTAIALLDQRIRVDGKPTAYVCQNFYCQLPVTDVEALQMQLSRE